MKVLKNIWKGIRFGIGMIFTVPFLISMFCMYLFGIAVTVNLVALISFIVLCCIISNILNLLSFKKLLKQILDEKEKESKQESDKCDSNGL